MTDNTADETTEEGVGADEGGVFDRFEEGQTAVTGGRTLTEADVRNFAGVSGDLNHVHLDEERMQGSTFGEPIVHGMLVLSVATGLVWQRRSPEVRDAVVAFYGIDRLRFRKPVFPGDTVHVETEVIETSARPDGPGNGTVRYALDVVNQHDEVVISCETISLFE